MPFENPNIASGEIPIANIYYTANTNPSFIGYYAGQTPISNNNNSYLSLIHI